MSLPAPAACYLPCDPSYPDDRLAMYLEDAGASVLLTVAKEHERAEALVPGTCRVLDIAAAAAAAAAASQGAPDAHRPTSCTGADPAYIIFTSGSTGRPKGAVVPHLALMDHLQGTAEFFGMGPADSSLLTITINFDPSLMQALSPLIVGGRLVIARPGAHTDGDYVTDVIAQQGVTHFVSTPSLALVQFQGASTHRCTALRVLMVGGEQLPHELIAMLATRVRCWRTPPATAGHPGQGLCRGMAKLLSSLCCSCPAHACSTCMVPPRPPLPPPSCPARRM